MPFQNRFRLPIKLGAAQFVDEREVFRKSNGITVVLSNIVRKRYQLTTDYLPEKLHERIKIALAHDTVNIEGEKYLGGVVQEGGYEINWPEFLSYPLGTGQVTVEVSPYNAANTNCGTCTEYSQVVTEDDNIGTVGEDETVIVAILYNDAICCSPFEISVVTFNTTYLDSANVVDNTLIIHTKTGIPIQNSVILATYRVTCENGMYDEANVIANVAGSVEECLSPTDLLVVAGSTTASATWDAPSPAPVCGYVWNLYLASDLGTPVQSGTEPTTALALTGLTASTNYNLQVAGDCCDEDISPFVSFPFTTNPPVESETCGEYEFTFNQSCPDPHKGSVTYLDCNDTYQIVQVFYFSPVTRCLRQTSPGVPVYWEMTATTAPPECDPYISITYIGPC